MKCPFGAKRLVLRGKLAFCLGAHLYWVKVLVKILVKLGSHLGGEMFQIIFSGDSEISEMGMCECVI